MKQTQISILVAGVLIGGAILYSAQNPVPKEASANNVSTVDGKQIILLTAKGGYAPRVTLAKAGVPTVLRVETKGTFDCSSAIVIPSMNYRANLKPSSLTDIELPPQKAGASLQGMCAMGMYNFRINFD